MAIDLPVPAETQDETPVEIEVGTVKKNAVDILSAAKFLIDTVDRGPLTVSLRATVIKVLEGYLKDLKVSTHYDDLAQQRYSESTQQIRNLNAEIRRLEALVGSQRDLDGVPELLSRCMKNLEEFTKEALGVPFVKAHPIEKTGFSAGWGRMSFYGRLSLLQGGVGEAPEAMMATTSLHEEAYLEDTPELRNYLRTTLQTKYPSLTIESFKTIYSQRAGIDALREIEIQIKDVSEML